MRNPLARSPSLLAGLILVVGCEADRATSPLRNALVPEFHAVTWSEWSPPVNLGPAINSPFLDQGASITRDGLSLYFQSDRPGGLGGTDIYISQRACTDEADAACAWQPGVNLGPTVNTISSEAAPRVTIDGHRLYLNSDRPGGFGNFDLYVSRRRDKRDDFAWGEPVNLGAGVNTAAFEAQADPFEDDETGTAGIHFTSFRAAGSGGLDIYLATLGPDGTFGSVVPVTELNTPFADQQPAIRRDGLEMFIASNRTGTFGLLDLWVTTRASTTALWSEPVNLGPVVNGTVGDSRPALSFDGTTLYFQSPRAGGFGFFDLYQTTRHKVHAPDNEE